MIFPALLLTLAGAASAQDAASLSRARAQASAAMAASSERDVRNRRGDPDDDVSAASREPLGNLHVVEPGLYRSAQPTREGYERLKAMGVKTILTLRLGDDEERREAGALGMTVMHVPMNGIFTPTFDQVDRALDLLATAPRPLLVHCAHGKDRTGFVVASYETVVLHRPIDEAVARAREAGCCFVMYEDLREFLGKYAKHRRRE